MDNEYLPPGRAESETIPNTDPAALEPAAVIEQVRELLFGEHRRATEGSLKSLEDRLAALTATIESRFADLERRLQEGRAESQQSRDREVDGIGAALKDLGEHIRALVAKPPA
jgi:hypothetical protein